MSKLFRQTFPKNFVWGASTSSYQIEGAWNEDGKGENVWDRFCHSPYRVANGDTGDVACDHYHHMEEDVELMQWMGLQSYRFSISWARVLPQGTGKINAKGLDFYDRLVDQLLEKGIAPNATLNHWDFPQILSEQGGWTNPKIVDWFVEYANVMFQKLGDRVDYWATHNEPKVVAMPGYMGGKFPPGHSSVHEGLLATHHLNLAHGKAVQLFRQGDYKGQIGIVIDIQNYEPATNSEADVLATQRLDELNNGLFLDPILLGQYPAYLLEWLDAQVPEELSFGMEDIHQPIDFLGMNYYMTFKVSHTPHNMLKAQSEHYSADGWGHNTMGWGIDPHGLLRGLTTLKEKYGNPVVMITENGTPAHDTVDESGAIFDLARIRYLREHISMVHQAIDEGCNVQGYYVWSLMDNFEWASGFEPTFGLIHVDFETLKRTPKHSALWYQDVIRKNRVHL